MDQDFKDLCEKGDYYEALSQLTLDKSPGTDGLTSNFYRHFFKHFLAVLKHYTGYTGLIVLFEAVKLNKCLNMM